MLDSKSTAITPGLAKHPEFARRLAEALAAASIRDPDRPGWIAELTGTTEAQAAGYLRGDYLPPEYRLLAIADALKVSAPWLSRGVGPRSVQGLPVDHGILKSVEPLVLRWVRDRQATGAGSGMDLAARAVPYADYVELEERYHQLAARLLRAEAAALTPPAIDVGPRDPRRWAARLAELSGLIVDADLGRRDEEAAQALAEAGAIVAAWVKSFG